MIQLDNQAREITALPLLILLTLLCLYSRYALLLPVGVILVAVVCAVATRYAFLTARNWGQRTVIDEPRKKEMSAPIDHTKNPPKEAMKNPMVGNRRRNVVVDDDGNIAKTGSRINRKLRSLRNRSLDSHS